MNRVSSSEHDLLTVARALVGEGGFDTVATLARDARRAPDRLAPVAMRLLHHTLAAGSVRALVRRGGWRRGMCLRTISAAHAGGAGGMAGAEPRRGRLWQRHEPIALGFGAPSMELLRWLVAAPLGAVNCPPLRIEGALDLGDELLLYLACDLVAEAPDCARTLAAQAPVQGSALCRLGFPDLLVGTPAPEAAVLRARFTALIRGGNGAGDGAVVLEGLSQHLAERWIAVERSKPAVRQNVAMQALGSAQEGVLGPFLDAIDAAGRRDLAGFLLDAAAVLLEGAPAGARWVQSLEPSGALRERTHARRAAAVVLRAVGRLRQWDEQHRAVRFFDDEYAAAQALLGRWERLGPEGFRRAEAAQHELEALVSTGTTGAPVPAPGTTTS